MDESFEGWKNHEREFRSYPDRFYKRSLRPKEYVLNVRGEPVVPPMGYERLQNEAACLTFIRKTTNIPVPDVLHAYDDEGAFVLVTQRLSGVRMDKLRAEDQAVVMKEVESHIQTLRNLRSTRTGGPSGLVCPPPRGTQYFSKDTQWSPRTSSTPDFVFCHCDLSQSNIIVDPEPLKIEGIIDWEHGGYWPAFFESPFFRDPRPSGAQFRNEADNSQFIDFLRGLKKTESNLS